MRFGLPVRPFLAVLALAVFVLAPVAGAEGPVYAGKEVTFTDLSSNDPHLFAWDFDYDGELPLFDSFDQNPTWTFDQAGVYTVFLEACNLHGCGTTFKTVVVQEGIMLSDDFETGDFSAWSLVTSGG